jgi:hypothetical protein
MYGALNNPTFIVCEDKHIVSVGNQKIIEYGEDRVNLSI